MYLWQILTQSKENVELLQPLVEKIYGEAVRQLNTRKPTKFHFPDIWRGYKLYKNEHILKQQQQFINDAHDFLDHRDWHLRCFEPGFAYLFMNVIRSLEFKFFQGRESPQLSLRNFKAKDFRKYKEIWEDVEKLVDKGIISVNDRDLRWRRYKSGYYSKVN